MQTCAETPLEIIMWSKLRTWWSLLLADDIITAISVLFLSGKPKMLTKSVCKIRELVVILKCDNVTYCRIHMFLFAEQ